ncbi:MAG: DNA repair protein RecO [Nevskiales bacterium]
MTRARVALQPAWVLHLRPYRDTSLLLEVFTRDHGRVGLVARGARRPRSRQSAVLQVLQPLLLSWQGAGELVTLTQAEAAGAAARIQGEALFAALYANELLLRLAARHDPHPGLFDSYAALLRQLELREDPGVQLRLFERDLLQNLGYGLNLTHHAGNSQPLQAESLYAYDEERGAIPSDQSDLPQISGASLLSLADGTLRPAQALEVKPILQRALHRHLGERGLQTPRLLRALRDVVKA